MRTTTTSIWNFESPPSGPRPARGRRTPNPYVRPLFCVNISHGAQVCSRKFAGFKRKELRGIRSLWVPGPSVGGPARAVETVWFFDYLIN